tara:strand:+ start:269 stop:766 length:498 start_codon:yes stop_codon:yes gene_type:complete
MAQFELGSISHGTLRTEDLLTSFADTLDSFDCKAFYSKVGKDSFELYYPSELILSAYRCRNYYQEQELGSNPTIEEDAEYLVNEQLPDALQEYCPPFVYFGTLEGDGSDFGFWPEMDGIQEIVNIAECDASQGISCPDDGVIIQVSDHGNVTVMDMERNVIWSVV